LRKDERNIDWNMDSIGDCMKGSLRWCGHSVAAVRGARRKRMTSGRSPGRTAASRDQRRRHTKVESLFPVIAMKR
jgi:hypothetical protein